MLQQAPPKNSGAFREIVDCNIQKYGQDVEKDRKNIYQKRISGLQQ